MIPAESLRHKNANKYEPGKKEKAWTAFRANGSLSELDPSICFDDLRILRFAKVSQFLGVDEKIAAAGHQMTVKVDIWQLTPK
jgi:hypothetical protein